MRIAVVGAGVVGLAVTDELLRRGHDVHCFEAAVPLGARSAGDTRIFRVAHDQPDLVEWAGQARQAWTSWSAAAGERLLGDQGTVISGEVGGLAEAMALVGADHRVTATPPPGLPSESPAGPFLVDPAGGIIDAAATGRWLHRRCGSRLVHERVTGLDVVAGRRAAVTTSAGAHPADAIVVAAGAGTPDLAAGVGIQVPARLTHHARFSYPLRRPEDTPPCWIDLAGPGRAGGDDPAFSTYGHLTRPGRWAVGGFLPPELIPWELGGRTATELARQAVTEHVRRHLDGVVPEPTEVVTCEPTQGLGDGLTVCREGPVIVAWGDNLYKFVPVIATLLADVATGVATQGRPGVEV